MYWIFTTRRQKTLQFWLVFSFYLNTILNLEAFFPEVGCYYQDQFKIREIIRKSKTIYLKFRVDIFAVICENMIIITYIYLFLLTHY